MKQDSRSDSEVMAALRSAGQGHVLRWWDELDPAGRARLMEQLRSVDLDALRALIADVRAGRINPSPAGRPELPDYVRLPSTPEEKSARENARAAGERLLRAGKVAAVTVAGGQGTRLGFDAPKGTFPIGPVSGRSLFQIHAERILATRRRCGGALPWYIMTSDATDQPTKDYLREACTVRPAARGRAVLPAAHDARARPELPPGPRREGPNPPQPERPRRHAGWRSPRAACSTTWSGAASRRSAISRWTTPWCRRRTRSSSAAIRSPGRRCRARRCGSASRKSRSARSSASPTPAVRIRPRRGSSSANTATSPASRCTSGPPAGSFSTDSAASRIHALRVDFVRRETQSGFKSAVPPGGEELAVPRRIRRARAAEGEERLQVRDVHLRRVARHAPHRRARSPPRGGVLAAQERGRKGFARDVPGAT